MFAQLSVDVGPENTVETAHRMGITSPLDAVPSITLGTSGVTPLEMADAYATLAADGIHHKPQAIVQVVNRSGKVIWKPTTKGNRAIPAGVASVVTQCLERVASAGTGSPDPASYFPYPRAGKTGTTENGWDVWYDGYTPQLAAAVWMGDVEKNSPMDGAYGGTYCAPMWAQVLRRGAQGRAAPELQDLPVDVQPVGGQDAGHVAVRVGVAVGERERQAEPRPDQDDHAGAAAHQDQTPTPQPTPTKTRRRSRRRRRPARPAPGAKQVVSATLSRRSRSFAARRHDGVRRRRHGTGSPAHWLAGTWRSPRLAAGGSVAACAVADAALTRSRTGPTPCGTP